MIQANQGFFLMLLVVFLDFFLQDDIFDNTLSKSKQINSLPQSHMKKNHGPKETATRIK